MPPLHPDEISRTMRLIHSSPLFGKADVKRRFGLVNEAGIRPISEQDELEELARRCMNLLAHIGLGWYHPLAACKSGSKAQTRARYDRFFPQLIRGDPDQQEVAQNVHEARALCYSCLVRRECLDYALANEKFGIWGGFSERQRKQISGILSKTPESVQAAIDKIDAKNIRSVHEMSLVVQPDPGLPDDEL